MYDKTKVPDTDLALCPAAAATMAAVAVAIPLIRCMKLRQIRSAMRIERALPDTTPNSMPRCARSPSTMNCSRSFYRQQVMINNSSLLKTDDELIDVSKHHKHV